MKRRPLEWEIHVGNNRWVTSLFRLKVLNLFEFKKWIHYILVVFRWRNTELGHSILKECSNRQTGNKCWSQRADYRELLFHFETIWIFYSVELLVASFLRLSKQLKGSCNEIDVFAFLAALLVN